MNIRDILNQLVNSDEVKTEQKRILSEIKKGPKGFDTTELMIHMLQIRMSGIPQEQMAVIGIIIINNLMRQCGISEDEMMEYIKLYK